MQLFSLDGQYIQYKDCHYTTYVDHWPKHCDPLIEHVERIQCKWVQTHGQVIYDERCCQESEL